MPVVWRVSVSIVAPLVIAILVWRLGPIGPDSQTAAAWVQAVGSIAAIIGAFWISNRQASAAIQAVNTAHKLEQRDRRRSILAVAEACAEHARRIDDAFSQPNPRLALTAVYDRTIINGMVGALGSAPAHEVGSRDGVIALLSLRDQFAFLGQSVDTYIAGPWSHPELKKAIDACGDSREQRDRTVRTGEAVLARNVQVHLGKIRSDYEILEHSMQRAIG